MKKATFIILFLGTIFSSMAQSIPDTSKPVETREFFLEKSKKNKTAALVLLVGGGVLCMVGGIIAANELSSDLENIFSTEPSNSSDGVFSGILVITGGLAMLGSIPVFKAASKNRRKAHSLSFKNELAPQLQRNTVFYKSVPSINLKIAL